jgi:hypothetical protein
MASKAFLTAQREATRKAHAFLATLKVGDIVLLDGQPITVKRALYQADGFGAWESAQVQLSYGPGRYSTEVSAARIGAGYVKLERAQ